MDAISLCSPCNYPSGDRLTTTREFSGGSEAGIDHGYREPYEHFMAREHSCYGDSIPSQSWEELPAREEREPVGLALSVAR